MDDLAALLDDCGVTSAVVYGGYLAQGFGVRHPARIAGMVLDSPRRGASGLLGKLIAARLAAERVLRL